MLEGLVRALTKFNENNTGQEQNFILHWYDLKRSIEDFYKVKNYLRRN